jgi:hypothetical protein
MANLARGRVGTDAPLCSIAAHNNALWLWVRQMDVPDISALLPVAARVSGMTSLDIGTKQLGQEVLNALNAAPLMPPSLTRIDLSGCESCAAGVWEGLLPTITNAPGLAGVGEVVLPPCTTGYRLSRVCHAPGKSRPMRCRVGL